MSKINIYVNSKNRKSDETPSNFSVIIPDGLIKLIMMNISHYQSILFTVTMTFTNVIIIVINLT